MSKIRLYGCSPLEQYELTTKLGEGTFGQVFKGTFKPTNTAVALKEIIIHEHDEGMPITALREIKLMKALKHPNVLHLLDMAVKKPAKDGSHERKHASYYMVMSYMDHDLCGLLHNRTVRFTLPHIKLYMQQLLKGIQFLHDHQYMHRDIKSANILVSNDGSLKIADFGLARHYVEASPTLEGTTKATKKYTPKVVTRWYRPPELLLGEEYYTPAIDMWGIGCIFGEFFKRQVILPGQSDEDQIYQIFKLLGAPNQENMPKFDELPNAKNVSFPSNQRMLEQVFDNVPYDALSLLSNLLTLDPSKRLTARAALVHPFFVNGAKAANPKDLPILPTSREIDVRRKRQAPSPLIGQNGPKRQERAERADKSDMMADNGRMHERSDKRLIGRDKRNGNINNRKAFKPKVWKQELSVEEQIPPYKRTSSSAGHRKTMRPSRTNLGRSADHDHSEPQVMRSGLDY